MDYRIKMIMEDICKYIGINDLTLRNQSMNYVTARDIFTVFIYDHFGYGYSTIAGFLGRDHSSLIPSRQRLESKKISSRELKKNIDNLQKLLYEKYVEGDACEIVVDHKSLNSTDIDSLAEKIAKRIIELQEASRKVNEK